MDARKYLVLLLLPACGIVPSFGGGDTAPGKPSNPNDLPAVLAEQTPEIIDSVGNFLWTIIWVAAVTSFLFPRVRMAVGAFLEALWVRARSWVEKKPKPPSS